MTKSYFYHCFLHIMKLNIMNYCCYFLKLYILVYAIRGQSLAIKQTLHLLSHLFINNSIRLTLLSWFYKWWIKGQRSWTYICFIYQHPSNLLLNTLHNFRGHIQLCTERTPASILRDHLGESYGMTWIKRGLINCKTCTYPLYFLSCCSTSFLSLCRSKRWKPGGWWATELD